MATFTLSDLRAEVEKKYAPTVIEDGKEEYVIPNLLQMEPAVRKQVLDLLDAIDSDDEEGDSDDFDEQFGVFSSILEVATADGKGAKLLELLDGNVAMTMELAHKWMETSQLGEAELSSE